MPALITRDQLRAEIDAGTITVVETLGPAYYESGHLPDAINIPHTQVRELAGSLLPDKDAAIVTYCSNAACRNSEIAANELIALGYSNVRKYAEGKQDWTEAGLPLSEGRPSPRSATREGGPEATIVAHNGPAPERSQR
jgi:rhodanese-related sulfurtransferase